MSSGKYRQYYPIIAANRKKLNSFISRIEKEESTAVRQNWACLALNFASTHSTGLYASKVIEDVFLTLAREYEIDLGGLRHEKNSVLHVVTEAYLVGGHTRVVERWIAQADPGERHSLVLLNQKDPASIPPKLRGLVRDRSGDFLVYDHRKSLLDRALELRRLGMGHEYIVLHIHPNDPIALLAFGTEEFTRPVILFNHADHVFWCGVAIADMVAELGSEGRERSLTKRGAYRSEVLGIPLDSTRADKKRSRGEARARLNLPEDKKIVLVSGFATKFRHIGDDGLAAVLAKIVSEDEEVLCFVIGADPKENAWTEAVAASSGRLRLLPPVDYDREYLDYLVAADLVLDSYPVPGGTAIIDAILAGRPVLTLKTAWPQSDFLMQSESYCRSKEELLTKARKILGDESYSEKIAAGTMAGLDLHHSVESWKLRRRDIINKLPSRHRIHNAVPSAAPIQVTDSDVLVGAWMEPDFFKKDKWRWFRHLFYHRYKDDTCRYVQFMGWYLKFTNRIFGGGQNSDI